MKKIIILFLFCFMVVLFSSCAADRNAMYDDDTKISKSSDSHFSQMSVYNLKDSEFTMSARAFTGTKTVWSYNVKNEGNVTFSYLLSVNGGGKAKLVLITPENEVITLAENIDNTETEEMQSQTVYLNKGKNRIKIVGYDEPKLTLVLSVDVGELVSK